MLSVARFTSKTSSWGFAGNWRLLFEAEKREPATLSDFLMKFLLDGGKPDCLINFAGRRAVPVSDFF
jgi:hypothetical protein